MKILKAYQVLEQKTNFWEICHNTELPLETRKKADKVSTILDDLYWAIARLENSIEEENKKQS